MGDDDELGLVGIKAAPAGAEGFPPGKAKMISTNARQLATRP